METKIEELRMKQEFEAAENDKNRQTDILTAQIRAAGYGAMQDVDKNMQSDYVDYMDRLEKTEQYQDTMSMEREKESSKQTMNREKLMVEREKIAASKEIADKQLQIARENKNKFDKAGGKKDKEK